MNVLKQMPKHLRLAILRNIISESIHLAKEDPSSIGDVMVAMIEGQAKIICASSAIQSLRGFGSAKVEAEKMIKMANLDLVGMTDEMLEMTSKEFGINLEDTTNQKTAKEILEMLNEQRDE